MFVVVVLAEKTNVMIGRSQGQQTAVSWRYTVGARQTLDGRYDILLCMPQVVVCQGGRQLLVQALESILDSGIILWLGHCLLAFQSGHLPRRFTAQLDRCTE